MILLLGYGISNKSIEKYLIKRQFEYIIYDDALYYNQFNFDDVHLVIKSPAIDNNHYIIKKANEKNIPVISDLEYYYQETKKLFPKKKLYIITGTNGKSTTVALLHAILPNCDLGGNIGFPVFDFIASPNDTIIEASSYMLEYTKDLIPDVFCLLNLYPNHLEHHGDFMKYCDAKMKALKKVNKDNIIIYNSDDDIVTNMIEKYDCVKVSFSLNKGTYFYEDNCIKCDKEVIYDFSNFPLPGTHNIMNALASTTVAKCIGAKNEDIERGLNSFRGLEHRLEYVGNNGKVKIYNDSKSTNLYALNSSLNSLKQYRITLICGGKSTMQNQISQVIGKYNITQCYLFGENGNILKEDLNTNIPSLEVRCYQTLEEVIDNLAFTSDVVLFSPGFQSFDQFVDFNERGKMFKKLINEKLV